MKGYKFRVLLDSKREEEVFRDILISKDVHFEAFYKIILEGFNLTGDVMASFYLSDDDWDKGQEISLMDLSMNDNEQDPNTPMIMQNTPIHSIMDQGVTKLILIYDFMSMLIFLVELIGEEDMDTKEAQVVLSIGESPDEKDRKMNDEFQFESDMEETDMDEDEYGFNEFSDGYSEEDFNEDYF